LVPAITSDQSGKCDWENDRIVDDALSSESTISVVVSSSPIVHVKRTVWSSKCCGRCRATDPSGV
jgi:hypothetical protein